VATGEFKERLLAIKRGEVPLDQVISEAESLAGELESARQRSPLPRGPDLVRADALLRKVGEEVARRWTEKVPGVFGSDAPVPPDPSGVPEDDQP
jgi:hypothetical protein